MGQTLVSNNVLLAEYLGAKTSYGSYDLFGIIEAIDQDDPHCYAPRNLKFEEDWNWLMAVVEKLSKDKNFEYRIERGWVEFKYLPIYRGNYFVGKGENRFRSTQECLFKACVELVEWLKNK